MTDTLQFIITSFFSGHDLILFKDNLQSLQKLEVIDNTQNVGNAENKRK